MQNLEVSNAVRHLYGSLCVKGLKQLNFFRQSLYVRQAALPAQHPSGRFDNTKISLPCWSSKHEVSDVPPVAWLL